MLKLSCDGQGWVNMAYSHKVFAVIIVITVLIVIVIIVIMTFLLLIHSWNAGSTVGQINQGQGQQQVRY